MSHYLTKLLLSGLCLWGFTLRADSGIQLRTVEEAQVVCRGQAAIYTLELSFGFRQNYSLSVEGLPVGTDLSFSPASIFPGSSSNLRIESGSLAAGSYPFRAVARAGAARLVLNLELRVASVAAPLPLLATPPGNSQDIHPNPTLRWTAGGSSAGITYEVQLATSSDFSTLVETAVVAADSYVLRQARQGYTTYYWRVRALSPCGQSEYTTPARFATTNISCRRYTNSTPFTLSEIGTSTVGRNILVADGEVLTDIAVELKLSHSYLGDLSARLLSPAGASFQLFDRPEQPASDFGCSASDLAARWTARADQSAASFENNCPQSSADTSLLTEADIYRPQDSFVPLRGTESGGHWFLEITDHAAGDGGRLEEWSLELCYAITSPPPRIVVNETLPVVRGRTAILTATYLRGTLTSATAAELVYRLLELPREGQLWRDGQALGTNATFTQADINANRMRYAHGGGVVLADSFAFSLSAPSAPTNTDNYFRIAIEPAELEVRLEQTEDILCAGDRSAALRALVAGGLPPYQYALNAGPYQHLPGFSQLPAGQYQVRVLDARGDTLRSSVFVVTEPPPLAAMVTVAARSLTVTASGGTPPYAYRLNTGDSQSSPVFPELSNGNYLVEVQDANDCIFRTTATVAVNDLGISTTIVEPISCATSNDGIIIAAVEGGQTPYEYRLNDGPFGEENIFFNLGPGQYTITVRDQQGFMRTSSALSLISPPVLGLDTRVEDFTVTLTGNGGTPPYAYQLSPVTDFQADNVFTLSANGSYTFTLRDSRNCLTTTTVTVAVNTLVVTAEIRNGISCAGAADAVIRLQVSGGQPPFAYQLNAGPWQEEPQFTALGPGEYLLRVRDADGFIRSLDAPLVLAEPPPLGVTTQITDNRVEVNASGGTPPYLYSLDNVFFQPSSTFTDLADAYYTIYVQDSQGCRASTNALVAYRPLQVMVVLLDSLDCAGDRDARIGLVVSSSFRPFAYQLDNGDFQADSLFGNLSAGNYALRVRDGIGREELVTRSIAAPAPLSLSLGVDHRTITAFAAGGVPPYRYQLEEQPWQEERQFTDLPNGEYEVRVSDANDCTQTAIASILVGKREHLHPETSLLVYPNPTTGITSLVFPPGWPGGSAELRIFDLYGRLVGTFHYPLFARPQPVDLSYLPAGLYLLQVDLGTYREQVRVVLE